VAVRHSGEIAGSIVEECFVYFQQQARGFVCTGTSTGRSQNFAFTLGQSKLNSTLPGPSGMCLRSPACRAVDEM
jgi:hypothetical protein